MLPACLLHTIAISVIGNTDRGKKTHPSVSLWLCSPAGLPASMAASFPLFTQMTSLLGPDGIHLASAAVLTGFSFSLSELVAHLYCFSVFSLLISLSPPPLCHCLPIRLSPPSLSPLTAKADCLFENGLWPLVKTTAWVVIDAARREMESTGSLGCNLCGKSPLNVYRQLGCWTLYLSCLVKQLATFFICTVQCWANKPKGLGYGVPDVV